MKQFIILILLSCLISFIWAEDDIKLVNKQVDDTSQTMDIKDFVKQVFIHGVPYEQASKYGPEVVSFLLLMLADTSEQSCWSNIVVTLGMIGDEKAVDTLIDFINQDTQGTLSPQHYTAKTSAIISLGYLINKTGNKKSLNFLKDCLNPNKWSEKKLSWNSPFQIDNDDRNLSLSRIAILGLAISAHPDAEITLRQLKKPTSNKIKNRANNLGFELINQAIIEYEKVVKFGLLKYDQEVKKKCQR